MITPFFIAKKEYSKVITDSIKELKIKRKKKGFVFEILFNLKNQNRGVNMISQISLTNVIISLFNYYNWYF